MSGKKINVKGVDIYYEVHGTGSQVVLLMPGGTGTTRDMTSTWEGIDNSRFKFVAWDPPGYGFSRPPERDYTMGSKLFDYDAEMASEMMQLLGYSSYSIVGWSDGGRAGLVMAVKYPSRIERMCIWGASNTVTERQKLALEASRGIHGWEKERREPYLKIYGEESQEMWNRHVNFYKTLDKIVDGLHRIRCPLFILHGDRDPVELSHMELMCRVVPDCRLRRFAEGTHNLHSQYPKEFNQIVQQFLEENDEEMF